MGDGEWVEGESDSQYIAYTYAGTIQHTCSSQFLLGRGI